MSMDETECIMYVFIIHLVIMKFALSLPQNGFFTRCAYRRKVHTHYNTTKLIHINPQKGFIVLTGIYSHSTCEACIGCKSKWLCTFVSVGLIHIKGVHKIITLASDILPLGLVHPTGTLKELFLHVTLIHNIVLLLLSLMLKCCKRKLHIFYFVWGKLW